MRKSWLVVGGVVVVVLLVGVTAYLVLGRTEDTSRVLGVAQQYTDPNSGISFTYDSSVMQSVESEKPQSDNVENIVYLATTNQTQPASVSVRKETKFRTVSNTLNKPPLAIVRDGLESNYPNRYDDFRLINQSTSQIAGRDAWRAEFTYQNQGQTIRQQFTAILKDDDTIVFVAFQALDAQFDELKPQLLDPIVHSLELD